MSTTPPTPGPVDVLQSMRADDIEARLDELAIERDTLRAILRVLRARERATGRGRIAGKLSNAQPTGNRRDASQ